MAGHTPGKWEWHKIWNHPSGEIVADGLKANGVHVMNATEHVIFHNMANAHLIAAAPELLEALEAAVASSPIEDEALDMAINAIRKARGEV